MKKVLLLACFVLTIQSWGQGKVCDNGLIYSTATMNKLVRIVDSLNLKYKACDQNKVFYARQQSMGHTIRISGPIAKKAKRDIDDNMPFNDFIRKYPEAKIKMHALILKSRYKDHNHEEKVTYGEVDIEGNYDVMEVWENGLSKYHKATKNTWVSNYYSTSGGYLYAIYFPDNFKSIPLSPKYNRLIGYVDCLIDTSTTTFTYTTKNNTGWLDDDFSWVDVDLPENWRELPQNKQKELLKEFRNTKVRGICSEDDRPALHAINIALLSAETANWEVFLRSHLDVMNDNFERFAYSSMARASGRTYIRELEELDINVPDLMLGIFFRIENPAQNHYYGSIDRLGKAIAESKDRLLFEKAILSLIQDKELDDYNRLLAYFLFRNYNYFIVDKTLHESNKTKLAFSAGKLPEYLRQRIKPDQE